MRFYTSGLITFILVVCLLIVQQIAPLPVSAETPTATPHRSTDTIPHITLTETERPFTIPKRTRFNNDPTNPYATLRMPSTTVAGPDTVAQFSIALRNFEAVTRTMTVTATLPEQLAYLDPCAQKAACAHAASAGHYTPETRTLSWVKDVAPAHLDYNIALVEQSIPYVDLADYGAVNLCHDFRADEESCAAASVTFNLGVNGYAATLYGKTYHGLTVSTDGVIMGAHHPTEAPPPVEHNRWLPHKDAQQLKLAGLWRASDLTDYGRWHVAIVDGLIANHSVFYAQWHDAPHIEDINLTVRHAIAVVLDGSGGLDGHVFYLYDNVSDPTTTVQYGYTIGIADAVGERGHTYAFGGGAFTSRPPQGYPPQENRMLHLYPTLIQPENAAGHMLTYSARVDAAVPENLVTTTVATSDSPDPALAYAWSTHYLAVRWQTYLPMIR